MEELYRRYGQLMIQAEILNAQIMECKRLIAEGLNKPLPKVEVKEGEGK